MPSKTPKQAKFMRAVAHGWKPSRTKAPPVSVAKEFVEADKKYSGGFAENRYWTGGLAAMEDPNAGYKGRLDWRRGGRASRNGGGGGGGIGLGGLSTESPYTVEEQAQRDAFLAKDIQPDGVWSTMFYNLQQQNQPSPESTIAAPTAATYTPAPQYTGPRMAGPRGGRRGGGRRGGRRDGGGPRGGGAGGGPTPGGSTTPPRIIPTTPASYVGAAPAASGAASPHVEQLRQHQAKIAATLGTGSARGGHVTGYAEGGTTRADNPFDPVKQKYQWRSWERNQGRDPDVAEVEAEVEEEVVEPEEEEGSGIAAYLRSLFIDDPETANIEAIERRIAEGEGVEAQAYGGRVGYQAGGLAQAAPGRMLPPVGGVPPWIEPVGSGAGYGGDYEPEPQGYQFGGMAARFAPTAGRAMRQSRGRQPRGGQMPRGGVMGGQYRGAPPTRGLRGMAARGELGPGTTTRYRDGMPVGGGPAPTGALAAMMQQAQQQRAAAQPGGGMGSRGPIYDAILRGQEQQGAPQGGGGIHARIRQAQQQQQAGGVGPQVMDLPPPTPGGTVYDRDWPPRGPMAPGGGPLQPGRVGTLGGPGYGEYPLGSAGPRMDPRDPRYRATPPPGSTFAPGEGIPGGGNIPPWKRPPGRRRAPPPGKGPGGSGPFIPGGPRVPPNLQGYLQRMRMQNRPPSGPVGGGGNRVGMQDQQGAMARALQRGTGRPPMSRRSAFGRAGPTP